MKDLALHIMDITQNSVRAGASEIKVSVEESVLRNIIVITITDNGSGMSEDVLKKATDPFYTSRTTRKVGMGLPLFKMNAEMSGGGLTVTSAPGKGTTVVGTFRNDHIDRPPMGDLGSTIALLISGNPSVSFYFSFLFENEKWEISTPEIKEAAGDTPLSSAAVTRYLKEMINENINALKS